MTDNSAAIPGSVLYSHLGYSTVAVEILADNAAPEAEAVYAGLGMPFSALVFGLRQYFSQG
jgi:hypothetical protein